MKPITIQFDDKQAHQIEAIQSITGLLDGLFQSDTEAFVLGDEIMPNLPPYYQLESNWMLDNLTEIQRTNKIDESLRIETESGFLLEGVSADTWEYPTFTVDMETGTGKTYVYLRSIYELYTRYALRKYIIIVPSVAIYEGVVKNFAITREHFKALYGNVNATLYLYDGSKPTFVKNFAVGQDIEVMVMTIDSFNRKANTIYKKTDKLMGERYPYQYLQETRPILILDESQNYRTEKSRSALRTLKPLFALNFSATPGRSAPNVVYRLSPFDAFRRQLVKKIEVLGMIEGQSIGQTEDYLRLVMIERDRGKIRARFEAMVDVVGSLQLQQIEVAGKMDLEKKTKNPAYAGWIVEEINHAEGFVLFKNGERFDIAEERLLSITRESLFKRQIEETIKFHLEKQKELKKHGVKVLSLFFIDRVANYVADDGMIKRLFDEAFERLKKRNTDFAGLAAAEVREGYFAKKKATKKDPAAFVDTALDEEKKTQAEKDLEREAYELIMKQKERLLSFDEPVSFIFAHSALREGWDNPNVFQICALREIRSEQQRRQTIGRGLRLPVRQDGLRLEDRDLNVLTVVANESYANYVARLQSEYEVAGDVLQHFVTDAAKPVTVKRNPRVYDTQNFRNFWNKLIQRTEYEINIESDELVKYCVHRLNNTVFPEPHIVITRGLFVNTEYRIELLNVVNGSAELRIKKQSTAGYSETTVSTVKAGTDLAKMKRDPVLKPFKVISVEGTGTAGKVVFSEGGTLPAGGSHAFSTEQGQSFSTRVEREETQALPKFNLIDRTCREVSLTRATVLKIFRGLNKRHKEAFIKNPEGFAGVFISTIRNALADHVAAKIEYHLTEEILDRDREIFFPETRRHPAKELIAGNEDTSVYDFVQWDSDVETKFIQRLNDDDNVVLYFKFPPIFKIHIPKIIGNYNPDWAILRWNEERRLKLELVRETKGNIDTNLLQHVNEKRKILCGQKHFAALGVSYRHITADTTDWWKEEVRETELPG
jgi:type III restriction enzyme